LPAGWPAAAKFCDPAVAGALGLDTDPDPPVDRPVDLDAVLAPSAFTTPAADNDTALGTG
jgi:hypothetical protein